MRKSFTYMLFILLFACSIPANAQKVYSCNNRYDADIKIFVVENRYDAELLVFKVSNTYDADGNKGLWFFLYKQVQCHKKNLVCG